MHLCAFALWQYANIMYATVCKYSREAPGASVGTGCPTITVWFPVKQMTEEVQLKKDQCSWYIRSQVLIMKNCPRQHKKLYCMCNVWLSMVQNISFIMNLSLALNKLQYLYFYGLLAICNYHKSCLSTYWKWHQRELNASSSVYCASNSKGSKASVSAIIMPALLYIMSSQKTLTKVIQ